ncbi:MAG: DUF736 family protein [Pseudomonadota bacterium]
MSNLGYVTQTGEDTYKGELSGLLNFRSRIELRPLRDQQTPNAPEMEVVTDAGVQIGTARVRTSKKSGGAYVNVAIKHPQITQGNGPIFANLGPANDVDNEDGKVFAIIAN